MCLSSCASKIYVCLFICLFAPSLPPPRCCSEFLCLCLEHYDGGQLTKLVSVVENLLTQAIRDADATARKFGRRLVGHTLSDSAREIV